jgi:hypothetical protein
MEKKLDLIDDVETDLDLREEVAEIFHVEAFVQQHSHAYLADRAGE